ncbi:multidrug transporter (plasmid) [Burkholderia glumae]|uniref:MATE family efflux transporter n=1 Tax=Burkholderia glumae TaxID=337 RepID=UPI002164A579|nr:MATE family efflux transporter [Burkholderia glumae]UVS82794.1 multidrug transporter [Burkholderia glumae]UVT00239.1 multidrug transporter [Burkholderia glumae]
MQNTRSRHFGEIVRLATPILGVRVLSVSINFIGMLFIARLGTHELAAGALVTALSNTVIVVAMSPLLAVGIVVGRLLGEQREAEVGAQMRLAWLVSVAIGGLAALVLVLVPGLLGWFGEPPALLPLVGPYLRAMAWGVIPALLMATCHQIFFPARKGHLVFAFSALNLALTLVLGHALIHGRLGLPTLGMAGWAYGVSIVNWIVMLVTFAWLRLSRDFARYRLFARHGWWSRTRLAEFLHISLPITLQFSSELLAFSAINLMVGWLGVAALSVQQILIQCSTLALMIPMGVGQASSILISMAAGRRELGGARQIGMTGLCLVQAVLGVLALLYLLEPKAVIGLYLDPAASGNAPLVRLASTMLAVTAFAQLFDGARNQLLAALRGLRDVWMPMWTNMALLWCVGLPSAYVLAFPFGLGLLGINLGFLSAFALGAVLMLARFLARTGDTPSAAAAPASR